MPRIEPRCDNLTEKRMSKEPDALPERKPAPLLYGPDDKPIKSSWQPYPEEEGTDKKQASAKKNDYTIPLSIRPVFEFPEDFVENQESAQNRTYRLQKRETAIASLNLKVQKRLNRVAFWTLISATIYAAITFGQWYELRKNFRVDERARVGIKSMRITQFSVGKAVMGDITVVNGGKTVAIDVTSPGGIVVTRNGVQGALDALRKLKQPFYSPTVLFPGIDQILPSTTFDGLDAIQAGEVLSGALQVFLIGDIHYSDVFGEAHTIRYCGHYRLETKRFENCGIKAD